MNGNSLVSPFPEHMKLAIFGKSKIQCIQFSKILNNCRDGMFLGC